jgi:hypothetical protein
MWRTAQFSVSSLVEVCSLPLLKMWEECLCAQLAPLRRLIFLFRVWLFFPEGVMPIVSGNVQ